MNKFQQLSLLFLASAFFWNVARSPAESIQTHPPPKSSQNFLSIPRKDVVAYYQEVATGSEYGGDQKIRRWRSPLRIKIHGTPTDADLKQLKLAIAELKQLTNLSIEIVGDRQNIDIYFQPANSFPAILSHYVPGNQGFAWVHWNSVDEINQAKILISSDGLSQEERSHLILEELTQSLGLLRDSDRYKDSIFYGGWTSTQVLSPMDKEVVKLHYQ